MAPAVVTVSVKLVCAGAQSSLEGLTGSAEHRSGVADSRRDLVIAFASVGLALQLAHELVIMLHGRISVAIGQGMIRDLRERLFAHVQPLTLNHRAATPTAGAVHRQHLPYFARRRAACSTGCMATTREIAIVGGGMAGLAAARVLARHGVAATLYEASDRLGGRAVTIEIGHELPVELGPEFIQGQPRATLDLVREAELEIEGIAETHHLWSAGHLVEIDEFWERLRPLLDHAGALSSDRSAREFLATEQATPDGARLFAMMVEGIYAAPLENISVESVVADAGGPGASSDQARLRRGYGRLVRWLAGEIARLGVVVQPGFAATRIDWRRDRVEIAAIDRVALADAVIVTVPLGVLASDAIHFEPDLGAAHRAALTKLAMGQVVKLVLCVSGELPGEAGRKNLAFVHAYDTPFPTFWVRTLGDASQITMWAAGPHAIALAGLAADQLAERAVDQLATTLRVPRGRLAARIMHRHFHDFAQDPFARGAYSYTRVGGMQAAATLSHPLGDRVFLAGEATDSDYEGSVAGAIASGTRAAEQVLRVAA